ncbi:ABC transporter permease [Terriglobus saanensis]|uniref:Permease n=1 Tax=Terriglobus saanensis (strain ATCC BAA-1853 / DSM 23119 / SP1PR4) TaxID=401053 RepID=E8V2X4_TERSS|nr:ABC transporter permease [Terriglobus saanensis]ADV84671.1 permease [Terriglobus saanensis SP1PR4]
MGFSARLLALFRKEKLSDELEEELAFHLAMREELNLKQGMPREEAKRTARKSFGNPGVWRERMSEIDLMVLPQTILQDLRYGFRMLYRNAGFTCVAIIALALGIGVNTAAYTAYKTIFSRSIDSRDPASMTNLSMMHGDGQVDAIFSYPDYLAYRSNLHSFDGLIAQGQSVDMLKLSGVGATLSQKEGESDSLMGKLGLFPSGVTNVEYAGTLFVSGNYFSVLGVAPLKGRTFDGTTDSQLVANPVVMLSENYWQTRFGGDVSVIGQTLQLNGVALTVIGVTPHNFAGTGLAVPDFWLPLVYKPLLHPDDRGLRDVNEACCRLFGRLVPGVSMAQAQEEMTAVAERLRPLHASTSSMSKPGNALVWPASPFPRKLDGGLKFAVTLIMIAVGMVLVIACANVASLQLARAAARQNELRMRMSLGASRARLVQQLLTESVLLGLIAGVLALFVTWGLLEILLRAMGRIIPPEYGTLVYRVAPDMQIFAYVCAISLVAGVLFGLTPALESSRSALASSLKANAETSPGRNRKLRSALIAAQVSVSLVLMITGSMLIRSSVKALFAETGYETKHAVDVEWNFPEGKKYDAERKRVFTAELRARVNAMPGVVATTFGRAPDGGGVRTAAVTTNGEVPTKQNAKAYLYYTYVQPNYFQTLGIEHVAGSSFSVQGGESEASVILSESAAKRLWPGENPIGRSLRMGVGDLYHSKGEQLPDGPTFQVIGLVHDVLGQLIDGSDVEQIYVPMLEGQTRDAPLLVRTQMDNAAFRNALRPVVASLDPDVTFSSSTLDQMLRQTPRFLVSTFSATVASSIGAVGLLLALMGIYGTVSYIVVLRTREVGIRMALGANRPNIIRLILRESTRPVMVGILAGMVLSLGAAYLLRDVLYGLSTVDSGFAFVGVSVLFFLIALLAAYMPSRRATRIDPIVALRYE